MATAKETGAVFFVKVQFNQPPDFLLRTLSQVQARHRMRPSKIADYVDEAVAENSMLEGNGFVRPEAPNQLVCCPIMFSNQENLLPWTDQGKEPSYGTESRRLG